MCVETALPARTVLETVLKQSCSILVARMSWSQCSNPAQVLHFVLARIGATMQFVRDIVGPAGEVVDLDLVSLGRAVSAVEAMAVAANDIVSVGRYQCWRPELNWKPHGGHFLLPQAKALAAR
ncbi:unnamed protein product [Prorocentrum cordatum]|uniref:Uncharacterized protein n=1 Tax=Prorocentrum cordatum TaxID=2364126 RepID=A0ABN9PTV7_9DINO|nr:unnamed protein product [Polarella glacialis]